MRISDWSSDVCSSDLRLRPCAQDKNVIDGGTGDFVNTLRLKRVSLFDIAGKMPGRTSGRVSAWHRKESDLLALEECIDIDPFRSVRGHGGEAQLRNFIDFAAGNVGKYFPVRFASLKSCLGGA